MNIRKLIIEDVRCFASRQEFDIRPLTFLVGENSTGKSTILGCFDTLTRFAKLRRGSARGEAPDFNTAPYQMGVFENIVSKTSSKKNSFKLGYEFQSKKSNENFEYVLTLGEKEKGYEPIVQEQKLSSRDSEFIILGGAKKDIEMNLSEEDGKKKFSIKIPEDFATSNIFEVLNSMSFPFGWGRKEENLTDDEKKFQQSMRDIWRRFVNREENYSFAPIRSEPRRTYDPSSEVISPDGAGEPMAIRKMSLTDSKEWKSLKEQLVKFGISSGLFMDIDVRNLGESTGDPFQLQFKVREHTSNLIDTGYGISQILPILVRLLNALPRVRFFMQQPEVHLHPKGQAELSSLLVNLMKDKHHNFIIETHSDAMIDRARIEIMKGNISPEDVSLIYLEPSDDSVDVHNITFDEQANFLGAPDGYREFFLKESDKLLGFSED